MKRKLLRQMSNEWVSNLGLALELLIVSVVVWYLVDALYSTISVKRQPLGFDIEHTYRLEFNTLNQNSPDYKEETDEEQEGNLRTLISRLEARPEIEAVGMGNNSFPYNGNNSGTNARYDTLFNANWVIRRYITPGFIKVFRYQGARGETPEELADLLEKNPNEFLISDNIFESNYGVKSVTQWIGEYWKVGNMSGEPDSSRLAAALVPVRYTDYIDRVLCPTVVRPLQDLRYLNELVVRVKDNMDHNFAENIMADASGSLKVGNYFIYNVKSMADQKASFLRGQDVTLRNRIIMIIFLGVNIFLGLLGTFWLRTRQRVHEIAIRKVNGASSANVFLRVAGEALLILTIVSVLALGLDYLLCHWELTLRATNGAFPTAKFFACALITYGIMAAITLLGILIPAVKATRVMPAIALAQE